MSIVFSHKKEAASLLALSYGLPLFCGFPVWDSFLDSAFPQIFGCQISVSHQRCLGDTLVTISDEFSSQIVHT